LTPPSERPQDQLRLRSGGAPPRERAIQPHSTALWTILSLSLLGYFFWYYRAQRECQRLLEDRSDPWLWMMMLFPGMLLVIPYAVAQARVVARVEIAAREHLTIIGEHERNIVLPCQLRRRIAGPPANRRDLCAGMALQCREMPKVRPSACADDANTYALSHGRLSSRCHLLRES